ncbi:uncharacterized protein LOC143026648 isoform X1 [Oratosquilla oratoria]|uniref:uncharacterized protein LOC143026648 isoform X1 n=1 Tax=Oratosquilla oratoria TaxID=337810 RepID=UPI003F76D785
MELGKPKSRVLTQYRLPLWISSSASSQTHTPAYILTSLLRDLHSRLNRRSIKMKTFVALLLVALAAVVLVEADPHRIHGPSQVYNTLPSTYNTAHFPNFRPGFGIFNYPPNQNLNRCKYWCPSYSGYGYTRRYYCCTHIHNQW